MRSQIVGRRYLAGLVMALSLAFLVVGTIGPARNSPYYFLIVPIPAAIAFFLGWRGWSAKEGSVAYSAYAIALLSAVLVFSHLLPRSGA